METNLNLMRYYLSLSTGPPQPVVNMTIVYLFDDHKLRVTWEPGADYKDKRNIETKAVFVPYQDVLYNSR